MTEIKLPETEYQFVEIVWEKEPIPSKELVQECEKKFHWKKSTTYTVLRRLCKKGILKNEQATVTSVVKKKDYKSLQSQQFVENNFDGSLPKFLAAFMSKKKLSPKQIDEIQHMIDSYKE